MVMKATNPSSSYFAVISSDRIIRVYNYDEVLKAGVEGNVEPEQRLQEMINKCISTKGAFQDKRTL